MRKAREKWDYIADGQMDLDQCMLEFRKMDYKPGVRVKPNCLSHWSGSMRDKTYTITEMRGYGNGMYYFRMQGDDGLIYEGTSRTCNVVED